LYKHLLNIPQGWTLAYPIDANWFLLGLFIWRLVIPYFNYIKHPIIISVIISLSVGFSPDITNFMELQRILTFLPFFAMGYFFPGDFKQTVLKYNKKLIPIIAFFGIVFMFFLVSFYFPGKGSFIRKCFIPSMGYNSRFGEYGDFGVFFRILSFGASVVTSYLFLLLVPDRKTWYSELGQRTLYVFLFHLILLYLVGKYVHYIPVVTELIAIPVATFITLVLSNKYLDVMFDKVLHIHHIHLPKLDFRFTQRVLRN
jgi:fucose 4-O-acetylase-like acetyltransferase